MMSHQNYTSKDTTCSAYSGRTVSYGYGKSITRDGTSPGTNLRPRITPIDRETVTSDREEELYRLWQMSGLREDCRTKNERRFYASNEGRIRSISSQARWEGRHRQRQDPPGITCCTNRDGQEPEPRRLRPILASNTHTCTRNSSLTQKVDKQTSLPQQAPISVVLAHQRLVNLEMRKKARQFKRKYPASCGRSSPILMPSQMQSSSRLQHTKSQETNESVEETLARAREVMDRAKALIGQRRLLQSRSFVANQASSTAPTSVSRQLAGHEAGTGLDAMSSCRERQQEIPEKRSDVLGPETSAASDRCSHSQSRASSSSESPSFSWNPPTLIDLERDFPDDETEDDELSNFQIFDDPIATKSEHLISKHDIFEQGESTLQGGSGRKSATSLSSTSATSFSSLGALPTAHTESTGTTQDGKLLPDRIESVCSSAVTMPTAHICTLVDNHGSVSDFKKRGVFAPKQLSSNGSSHGATLYEPADEARSLLPPLSPKSLRWNMLKAISLRSILGGTAHSQHGSKEASAALTLSTSLDNSDTSGSAMTPKSPPASKEISKGNADEKVTDVEGCVLGPNLLLCRKDKIAKDEWYLVKAMEQNDFRTNPEEEQVMEMVFYD